MAVIYVSVLPHCLSTVVRGLFFEWEWVRSESEPQATSACGREFMLLHGGFQLYGSSLLLLVLPEAMSFTITFFFLGQRRGQVIGGGKDVI